MEQYLLQGHHKPEIKVSTIKNTSREIVNL